ncbi:galactose oxidase/kelch repeat superfamily protein [Tasmannia lanceolata]|uniref:galactose oxidase/kelch repeat superfamily protein n=1 Tax=Tasmannia lanceolata TaxID=3420 RepID=UPI0040648538
MSEEGENEDFLWRDYNLRAVSIGNCSYGLVKKSRVSGNLWGFDEGFDDDQNVSDSSNVKPQDADYSYVPSLSDELALLILARVPRSDYAKLYSMNKRYLALLRSGELFKIRREIGIKEPTVFMLPSGEPHWWSLDPRLRSCRKLPVLPSDSCFTCGDKETLCAGTHLLVSGMEIHGLVIWRYELAMNRWFKGPSMRRPRCLFASASCGNYACLGGGVVQSGIVPGIEILNSAEKYDPVTKLWHPLPRMIRRRKLCAGCYMDNKFYVIGGQNEDGNLTCGEFYDAERNTWELIPDMIKDFPNLSSPPLVAVVNNELYSLDASSNQLKVYLKGSNSWKELGNVPVRADHSRGWGVAFKSLGNELLVIGGVSETFVGRGMTICTCCPDPNANDLQWLFLDGNHMSPFVFNCSVMVV